MYQTLEQENINNAVLSLALFAIIYLTTGIILALVSIKLNNSVKSFNSIQLENKKIFQEFMALCLILPFVAFIIILFRYLSFYYEKSYSLTKNIIAKQNAH